AEWVIRERQIEPEWVAQVVARPTRTEPDKEDPSLRHALGRVPEFGDRILRVVYRWEAQPSQVVTAHFDRRLRNTLSRSISMRRPMQSICVWTIPRLSSPKKFSLALSWTSTSIIT